ncbi:MAG: hypothetical protein ACI92Z_003744 [Paracoccaceae bacterium]|jgi:hypothetical protein
MPRPFKSKPFTPKIVTASDLLKGDVIYQTGDDHWTRHLSEAEIITDEAHAQIRLLDAERQNHALVGAYLANVALGANGPEPVHFREEFRRTGPSNYSHGKQAGLSHV